MLMKDPKKSLALIIASKGKMPENADTKNGAEQDDSMAYDSAAEEVLQAIESKDVKALVEALKSFHELCEKDEDDEQPEQEQPESEPPQY